MISKAEQFIWPPKYKSGDFGISELTAKVAVQVLNMKDEMLVEACKNAAQKAGITELTLIDEDSLINYFGGVTQKQKWCPYCRRTHWQTDDKLFDVSIAEVTPMPAINLMTGEVAKDAKPPFYAMIIGDEEVGQDFLPISFCPICGRKLEADNKKDDEGSKEE